MTLTRRCALGLVACAVLFSGAASAQEFPTRVIKMVVPYPAGGPTDAIARIVAEEMRRSLGQNVVVENIAGASGAIGTRAVAKADPDGYTIVFGNNQTHGNNMFLLTNPGYDAVKDFAPLAGAGAFEHIFVVKNDLPAKTIPELVDLAKKDPGKLNYGSTGIGSGSHLSTELFMVRTGTKMTHVPFRSSGDVMNSINGGHIDVAFDNMTLAWPQAQAGTVRALGVTSLERSSTAPDVPAASETLPGFEATSWHGVFVPAGTPRPVVEKINAEVRRIVELPEVKSKLTEIGAVPSPMTPEEFTAFIKAERTKWEGVVKAAGLTGN